jgi:hypothetical protein
MLFYSGYAPHVNWRRKRRYVCHPCYFGLHRSCPRAILPANGEWILLGGEDDDDYVEWAAPYPLDPIGSSPSNAIWTFYAAILVVSMALGGLLVIWLQARLAPSR